MECEKTKNGLQVYFDGSCPLCRREIAFYERLDKQQNMEWINISQSTENRLPQNVSQAQAMSRFHVSDEQGRIYSGGRAFAELWVRLPAFRILGKISRLRPVAWMLEQSYRGFLSIRPRISQYLGR